MAAAVPPCHLLTRRPPRAQAAALLGLLPLVLAARWVHSFQLQGCKDSAPAPVIGSRSLGLPRRGGVYLRYVVGNGLCNQLNGHINAFTLADALGVHGILVPPATHRTSFNHAALDLSPYLSAPAGTLLDVAAIRQAHAPRGIHVLEEGLQEEEGEWSGCAQARLPPAPQTQIGTQLTLAEAVARSRALISAAWAERGLQACVVLHAGITFFSLRTASTANMTAEVASRLAFPPGIEALAGRAVDAIGGPFNGVHLRVEKDMGLDPKATVKTYVGLMQGMAFDAYTPLYVASGLLSYNDTMSLREVSQHMVSRGVASRVVVKEEILPAADLAGLLSEQRALLDLLVLAGAQRFVGHGISTFSHYAAQYQILRGGGRGVAALVPMPGNEDWHDFLDIVPTA